MRDQAEGYALGALSNACGRYVRAVAATHDLAPLFAHGATMDGSLSWSGKTLVLTGADLSAIGRGEYATAVWKSTNDGDDWTDETGDLVTISPGPGVWYEQDFYFVTRGEGVTVKRNFEAGDAALVEK